MQGSGFEVQGSKDAFEVKESGVKGRRFGCISVSGWDMTDYIFFRDEIRNHEEQSTVSNHHSKTPLHWLHTAWLGCWARRWSGAHR